jgi:Arc/MetJ family transcription regulator
MRTTITLDPDVETLIKTVMREQGLSFKDAVNSAIRRSLTPQSEAEFKQRTFALGWRPQIAYDKALQIAAAVEDEELLRKLAMGK